MNRSTFCEIKYINGLLFSKAMYMTGVGFKILARTLIPKLPVSYFPRIGCCNLLIPCCMHRI